jgi:3-hydroxyacyl-[acyl-carrier-protein] dehydratase
MSETSQHISIDSVKAIIRHDLNLEDEPINDDMPLIGGEMDLDSLDVLMLVTSIEKKFGVKIMSDEAGKDAFATVATLTAFIEQSLANAPAQAVGHAEAGEIDLGAVLDSLPHQAPFRFVSEMKQLSPGERGVGLWRLSGEEDFFAGHFPGQPLVPGVLISEALAQVSGVVFASANPGVNRGQLAAIDVKLRSPVAPPAMIKLTSTLEQSHGDLHVFGVTAQVEGRTVAEGRITLFQPAS